MPQGLQINDEAGNLIVDITTRLNRVIGRVDVNKVNGSVSNAGFAEGIPYFVMLGQDIGLVSPNVTFSGNTMTWTYDVVAPDEYKDNTIILYGVY